MTGHKPSITGQKTEYDFVHHLVQYLPQHMVVAKPTKTTNVPDFVLCYTNQIRDSRIIVEHSFADYIVQYKQNVVSLTCCNYIDPLQLMLIDIPVISNVSAFITKRRSGGLSKNGYAYNKIGVRVRCNNLPSKNISFETLSKHILMNNIQRPVSFEIKTNSDDQLSSEVFEVITDPFTINTNNHLIVNNIKSATAHIERFLKFCNVASSNFIVYDKVKPNTQMQIVHHDIYDQIKLNVPMPGGDQILLHSYSRRFINNYTISIINKDNK